MQIKLDDNSLLTFTWARPGLLNVQLAKPGFTRDGHGWFVRAATLLDGQELQDFLDGLDVAAELEPPPRAA